MTDLDPAPRPRDGRAAAVGEASSRELTEAHLDAAERDNHALNAWLTIDRERALAEADAADARLAAARADGGARSTRSTRCSASRSRSRTSSRSRAASARPARGSSRATSRRTTPTSPSGCATPAR